MLGVSAPESCTVNSEVTPYQTCPRSEIARLVPVSHRPTAPFSFCCMVWQANDSVIDTSRCEARHVTLDVGVQTMT